MPREKERWEIGSNAEESVEPKDKGMNIGMDMILCIVV